MKKRFYLFFLMLIFCIVPVLSGCSNEYKSTDVISLYNTIKSDVVTKSYFKNGKIQVTYNVSMVSNNIKNTSSPLYILGGIYEPIVTATSEMFVSQFDSPVFTTYIDKFSKDSLTDLYNGLDKLSKAIKAFDSAKNTFEMGNTNSASGTFLSGLLAKYNDMIECLININTTFSKEYYSKVTLVSRALTDDLTLANLDVTSEIMQTKNYLAQVVFEMYVKNYTLTNPPTSAYSFENDSYTTYLKSTLETLRKTYSLGSVSGSSSKLSNLRNYLTNMRNNYDSFMDDKDVIIKAIGEFDYKTFFKEPSKESYINNLSQTARDNYNVTQNFLETKFSARKEALNKLITSFVA